MTEQERYENMVDEIIDLKNKIKALQAENERLNTYLDVISCSTDKIKAEAYKECIEKVKAASMKKVISYVADFSIQEAETGWLEIQEEKLDNLLKEMGVE